MKQMVFDIKIGSVTTPHQLSMIFQYEFMKYKLGVALDSYSGNYVVQVQNDERGQDAKPYDEIVYLGLGTWKVNKRDTY